MIFRSIRVTLLFWYAVVLLGSVAVLGTVLHREMRAALYREADAQLVHWRDVLQRAGPAIEATARASLPATAKFAVFDAAGRCSVASAGCEPATPHRAETVTRDDHRWASALLPGGGWLVVGRSVREENHGIRGFLSVLLLTGAGIVALALCGGYVLVSRALSPALEIAATAHRISAANLGERIPLARVPAELRAVATTLNESFARLEAAFARQVAFTADASHELRTPLAILLAHLELAARPEQSTAELRERLAICRDAAVRLESIVGGLLTLARADAGQVPFAAREVDLAAVVQMEIAAMAPLAGRRAIQIGQEVAPVAVIGDRERLREVVTNLLDNAIRYNVDGGRVTVSLARDSGCAVLRVADTGIGIADEHRDKVFERFYRADPARARSRGGSGLGLAITRWIVERHGGSIELRSREGEGAEFTVRLPVASGN